MFPSLTVLSYWQSFLELVDFEVLSLSFVLFEEGTQLENTVYCMGSLESIIHNYYVPIFSSPTVSFISDCVSIGII